MTSYTPHRGRRGARGNSTLYNSPRHTAVSPEKLDIHEGLADACISEVKLPSSSSDDIDVHISDVKDLGSYNWVEAPLNEPTIIVPGSPPLWLNRVVPYRVARDTGLFFVDQNGYRMAKMMLLPLFKAVDIVQEAQGSAELNWSSVDFITDRNGLRKLVRWVKGSNDWVKDNQNNRTRSKTFRIDIQLAGERTVLLNRWEHSTRNNVVGYGHNFERESTKPAPGCKDSTGHHRIVNYNFDGLNMVVRFEVDACINTSESSDLRSPHIDDLETTMAKLSISPTSSVTLTSLANPVSSVQEDGLKIRKVGVHVPRTSIVELTTLTEDNRDKFIWDEVYFQLLLSQTPHHFLALHQKGNFMQVEKRKLSSPNEMMKEGDTSQRVMKALKRVLEAIQKLAIAHGPEGRLSLVYDGTELKVYTRTSADSFLPESVLSRFK